MIFKTSYTDIIEQINRVDPIAYGRSRNFSDGAVSYLSPYISRGVISTRQAMESILTRDLKWYEMEKFLQELAWRDYWQQVWISKGDEINSDLKHPQEQVSSTDIPSAIVEAKTDIEVIDQGIIDLYDSGYMHNHMRMYVASLACNIARRHWFEPARWMYYHLLDGDWASNALSWQWVAGANANKKYMANQENINKYFYSDQKGTFLDVSYEALSGMNCPEMLIDSSSVEFKTKLPTSSKIVLRKGVPTLVYNYYNMDPEWRKEEACNRVLLIEPSVFAAYPVADHCMEFMLNLGKNISGLQVFVGSFDELVTKYRPENIIYKEHPLNGHYMGIEDARDWMFGVKGYFPSFFAYWKKCKKELAYLKTK